MHPVDIIRSLERQVKEQLELLQPILVDQSRSLSERWDMFSKVAHMMPTDMWYSGGHTELLDISLYDDLYIDRHEQIGFIDFYERLVEYDDENPLVSQDKLDAWREKILASGYGGFRNDW